MGRWEDRGTRGQGEIFLTLNSLTIGYYLLPITHYQFKIVKSEKSTPPLSLSVALLCSTVNSVSSGNG